MTRSIKNVLLASLTVLGMLAAVLFTKPIDAFAKSDAVIGITSLKQISEDTLKVGFSANGESVDPADIVVTYVDGGKKVTAVIEDIWINATNKTEGKIKMLAPMVAGKEYTFKLGKSKKTVTAASLTLKDVAGFKLLNDKIAIGSLNKIDYVMVDRDGVAIPARIVNDSVQISNTQDSFFDLKLIGNSWCINLLAPGLTFPLEYEFYNSYMLDGRTKVDSLKGKFEVTGIDVKDQKDYYSFDYGFDQNHSVRTLNLEDGAKRLYYKAVLDAKNTLDQYEIYTDADSSPRYDFISLNSDIVKVAERNNVVYFTPVKAGRATIDVYRFHGTNLEKKVGSFAVDVVSGEAGSADGDVLDPAGGSASKNKGESALPVLEAAEEGIAFELSSDVLDTTVYSFNNDGTGVTPAKKIPEISISYYKVKDGKKASKPSEGIEILPSTGLTKAVKKKTSGKLKYWFTVTDSNGRDVTALFTDSEAGGVISGWSISENTTYNAKSGAFSGGRYEIRQIEKLPAGTCTVSFAKTGGGSAYTKLGKVKFEVIDSEYKPDVRLRQYDINAVDDEHVKGAFDIRHYSSVSNKSYEVYNSIESFSGNYTKLGKTAVFVEKFNHQILLELGSTVYVCNDPITLNVTLHVGGYKYND